MSRARAALTFLFLLLVPTHASRAAQAPRVTGLFSDMTVHEEEGDIAGVEILISRAWFSSGDSTAHFVYIQVAEGVPDIPQLVRAQVEGSQVSFTMTFANAQTSTFRGRVRGDSLIGAFSNGWELRLPRRRSFWR